MRLIDSFVLGLVAAPAIAHGQFIGGRVSQFGSQRPAPGARVVALQEKRDIANTLTDSSGAFYLGPLKPGVYRLRIGDGTAAPFLSDTLRVRSDDFLQREFRLDTTAARVYYEFEVAKSTAPFPGQRAPRYPADLRNRRVNGEVIARFVVDTTGHVIEGSFGVLSATDSGFVGAVADAVYALVFFPAELPNGRKVRQLAHMPFQFNVR